MRVHLDNVPTSGIIYRQCACGAAYGCPVNTWYQQDQKEKTLHDWEARHAGCLDLWKAAQRAAAVSESRATS